MNLLDARVTSESEIIEVAIDDCMRQRIVVNAAERKVLNPKTLTDGEGNAAGFAGEEIVHAFLPMLTNDTKCFDWDFTFTVERHNVIGMMAIDVKSKGNNKHKPELDYDCTVPKYQVAGQQCNVYIFTRINHDLTKGWINGWIIKERFQKEARIRKAGESYNNAGRETKDDHLVIPVSALIPIELLKSLLMQHTDS